MSRILETEHLTKSYGPARGIIDISLTVEAGEIFGFIGPNGAGKSTFIRTLLGLLFPDQGLVRLFGRETGQQKEDARLRGKIGFVPSELNYYEGLKAGRLLDYAADLYDGSDRHSRSRRRGISRSRIGEYAERLKLDLDRPLNDLSLGNRKKVAIVQALIHRPELLILDEPTSGLDPLMQARFYEILAEEKARGTTVFFSSHTLSEVERLCSRVAIIREGRIIEESGLDQLKRLSLKRFRLVWRGEGGGAFPVGELEGLAGVSGLACTGRSVQGLYGGDVRGLLACLAGLPVGDVTLEDPGLEEIFMHYYSDGEANHG